MFDEIEFQADIGVCEDIVGNETDIDLEHGDCEVRADITVKSQRSVRVWGQVNDCEGRPVKGALVTLLRYFSCHGKIEYEGVAHTTTDCQGFYQFDVDMTELKDKYKIIVGKASRGSERIIHEEGVCYTCPCEG